MRFTDFLFVIAVGAAACVCVGAAYLGVERRQRVVIVLVNVIAIVGALVWLVSRPA